MVHVFKSLLLASLGMASLGWLSLMLIGILLGGPDGESTLTQYVADHILYAERIDDLGLVFSNVSKDLFKGIAWMNITFLGVTVVMTLSWSALSHFLNIDAPGKAKIYFIHWSIFTGILIAIFFAIAWYFTNSVAQEHTQYISTEGSISLTVFGVVFYTLIYYLGVLLGTARFARSSVLFANKLPGVL